jgi:hypothetical protein
MVEHDGWLYAGTGDSSSFLALPRLFFTAGRSRRWGEVMDRILEEEGGFDLWRSRDGIAWALVTNIGFGSQSNWSLESMASTSAGLFVGTVAMPQSGCEIWLGR